MILNLIVNSVEAMKGMSERPRELLITTAKAEPNGLLVAIQDSGPGVAPGDVERVFEPFYSTKPDGLGMGLSICRSIVEAHGGKLWATGEPAQGCGLSIDLGGARRCRASIRRSLFRNRRPRLGHRGGERARILDRLALTGAAAARSWRERVIIRSYTDV